MQPLVDGGGDGPSSMSMVPGANSLNGHEYQTVETPANSCKADENSNPIRVEHGAVTDTVSEYVGRGNVGYALRLLDLYLASLGMSDRVIKEVIKAVCLTTNESDCQTRKVTVREYGRCPRDSGADPITCLTLRPFEWINQAGWALHGPDELPELLQDTSVQPVFLANVQESRRIRSMMRREVARLVDMTVASGRSLTSTSIDAILISGREPV